MPTPLGRLTVIMVSNDNSDGNNSDDRASQIALPANKIQPSGPGIRTPAKKSKSSAENKPTKAARFAVGQDVL